MRANEHGHLERRVADAAADVEDTLPGADLRNRRHAQRDRPGEGLEERLPSPPAAGDRLPLVTDPVVLPCHGSHPAYHPTAGAGNAGDLLARPDRARYERQVPFLSHAGVSLRYDRAGTGPPVLLVHGWTCNRTFWERQVQTFRDRFTLVTVDLRGHGESSHPRSGYTIGALAGDLEHLVRALGVPRLALVGWSMGGLVVLELARRLGERVSALGLVCTTAGGLDDRKSPRAAPDRAAEMRAAVAGDFRAFVRQLAADFFKKGAESPLHPWAVAQMQKTPPHVASACLEGVLAADLRPHLPTLDVPTAVLHGRHDRLLPLGDGEALAKGIRGARLVVFEESGHAPFLEEPDAFNTALGELLAR
ncbi:MAG: alpha/beta hydrolase [Deltaproteobacteria bacterium]|nr:MAG: alpha/beta hydrolase [Deltaproteobacteria bacterium]